jgi:hypothetical protein
MDSLDISAKRCINLYPEVYNDGNTKTVKSLRCTHGLLLLTTLTGFGQRIRGLYVSSTGVFFGLNGKSLFSIDTAGATTSRATLSTGDTFSTATIVRMADNGVSMLIADGTTSAITYVLATNTATAITDADYPGGSFCGILDGFYIVNKPNTLFAYYSAIDDPTTWSALSTITKEGTTDYINGLIVSNRRLWLFGPQSYEVHYNTGDSNNQFLRIEGTYHEIGLQAPNSLAQDGSSVYWLGGSAFGFSKVYKSQGFEPVSISTVPIERAIQGYTTTSDAEAFCFQQDGHSFYQLTFPSENKTWVYDSTTGMWHEKLSLNTGSGTEERHRARVQAFFNGNNYFGDWNNARIYEASTTTYTDNSVAIIRTVISPTVWNANERIYYDSFQLDVGAGIGLTTGQGSNPKIMLEISNDGGHTYLDKKQLEIGKIGEFNKRCKKNRCGSSRRRVWKVTCSDPIPLVILSAHAEIT